MHGTEESSALPCLVGVLGETGVPLSHWYHNITRGVEQSRLGMSRITWNQWTSFPMLCCSDMLLGKEIKKSNNYQSPTLFAKHSLETKHVSPDISNSIYSANSTYKWENSSIVVDNLITVNKINFLLH